MSDSDLEFLQSVILWYLDIKLKELQEVVNRYEMLVPNNIGEAEQFRQQTTWRKYAVSGLKKAQCDCTVNVLRRMFEEAGIPREPTVSQNGK